MDKQSLLQEVSELASKNAITKEELLGAYSQGLAQTTPSSKQPASRLDLAAILYYIGGAVIFLGVWIYIGKNWSMLSPLTRVFLTFGTGIVTYFIAIFLSTDEQLERIGQAFFLAAALTLPVGIYTLLDNAGVDARSYKYLALNAGLLAAVFYASYFLFKKNVLLLFAVLFSTWLYFDVAYWINDIQLGNKSDVFIPYAALLAGLIYAVTGYLLSESIARVMTGFLYSFGIIGILSAALCLTGWPVQNHYWEVLFPLLTFVVFMLSIKLESKSFLVFGSLFLIGYILKMFEEYYTGGAFGPLLLVVVGLLLIVVGYATYFINNRFLSNNKK